MFWRMETALPTSSLASLLDKPDVTLLEIMDDEYVLQEVKYGNKRLTDFLIKPENLLALTKLCVTEPESSEESQKKYKYAHLASEILGASVKDLTDALSNSSSCFNVLADFVSPKDQETNGTLNPLLASFFSKVFAPQVSQHADQVLTFMHGNPAFLDNLVANLDVSALAESLFRLASGGENSKHAQSMKKWLVEKGLVSKLIWQFDSTKSVETHQNVSYLLCELIRNLRRDQLLREDDVLQDQYLDPLVEQFESRALLDDLLERVLAKQNPAKYSESVTANGCAVFMTLLQTTLTSQSPLNCVNEFGKYEETQDEFSRMASTNRVPGVMWEPDANRVTEQCLASCLEGFKRLLEKESKEPLLLPMGKVDVPLGSARLAVTQLLSQLLASGSSIVHEEFVKVDLMGTLLGLFFKYKWNNFLHTNVINCILCALYGRLIGEKRDGCETLANATGLEVDEFGEPIHSKNVMYSSPMLNQLLEQHKLLKVIVQAHEEVQAITKKPGEVTPPYIGHVMRLALCTYYAMQDGPNAANMKSIVEKLPQAERESWNNFVQAYLMPYIKRSEPDQVGVVPSREGGVLSDHTEDFNDGPGATTQQARSPVPTVNPLGTTTKTQDNSPLKMRHGGVSSMQDEPMDVTMEPMSPQAKFEELNAARAGLANRRTDPRDEWAEKEITFGDTGGDRAAGSRKEEITKSDLLASSSDEDEEKMEIDDGPPEWFSTPSSKEGSGSENWASFDDDWPASSSTPISHKDKKPSKQDDWANFGESSISTQSNSDTSKPSISDDPWASETLGSGQGHSKDKNAVIKGKTTVDKGDKAKLKLVDNGHLFIKDKSTADKVMWKCEKARDREYKCCL